MFRKIFVGYVFLTLVVMGCRAVARSQPTPTPTKTPKLAFKATSTVTSTLVAMAAVTSLPTDASLPTDTPAPTAMDIFVPTDTPVPAATDTLVPTDTPAPPPPTATPEPTAPPALTPTPPLPTNIPRPSGRVQLFGIDLGAITEANGLPEVVAAGMRWVRRASLRWDLVQPTGPDVYDWSAVSGIEAELISARSAGLEPIVVIHGTPSWAQKVPGWSCGPIKEDCLDDFATFVSEVVQRYKGSPYNVRFWELWNEPDVMPVAPVPPNSGWGCWGDSTDSFGYGGGYYAEMLKRAYPAVKAADAEAQVLIGGLLYGKFGVGPSYEMWRFLRGVLAAGGGDYFDIVSYHAYSPGWDTWPSDPENILEGKTAHIRQVLAEYGHADKPMMCTEAGYRTFHDDSKLEAQADYVVTDHVRAFSLGLKAHIWYGFYRNDFSGGTLLDPETRSPKPAYYAYQAMTQQLDGLYYQGRVEAESKVEEHKFGDGVRTVWVIWTADGDEHGVHFPTAWSSSGQFWVRDKYGQGDIWSDATDGNVDGQVTVQVSGSPFYVEPVW